jgi:transglutaminase-like putative cysteine protease
VRTVRGLDGQLPLRLDTGRSLARVPLTRRAARLGGGLPPDLQPIERARLDARRLLRASSLAPRAALARLVRIVQQRLPYADEATYQRLGERELARHGVPRLSEYVRARVGLCRERAFLLAALLREGGLPARVRYGVAYDRAGTDRGGHAWVETRQGGRLVRLDPNVPQPVVLRPRQLPVEEVLADGRRRRVTAMRSRYLLYVPTADLKYLPGD